MALMSQSEAQLRLSASYIISSCVEDPNRPGLKETPTRFAKAWQEMLSGYEMDPDKIIKVFEVENCEDDGSMVTQNDIPFTSICEHHLLPFFGTIDIVYVPVNNLRIGLSKLPRLVKCFSKRLQVQERLVCQIADTLFNHPILKPSQVLVRSSAIHMCVQCRGAEVYKTETRVATERNRNKNTTSDESSSHM